MSLEPLRCPGCGNSVASPPDTEGRVTCAYCGTVAYRNSASARPNGFLGRAANDTRSRPPLRPAAPAITTPWDAAHSVLTRTFDFSGYSGRGEYWWWMLLALPVCLVLVSFASVFLGGWITLLILGLLVSSLAVTIRRLHDAGIGGWWVLLIFFPFGGFVLLILCALPRKSDPDPLGS